LYFILDRDGCQPNYWHVLNVVMVIGLNYLSFKPGDRQKLVYTNSDRNSETCSLNKKRAQSKVYSCISKDQTKIG